MLKDFFKKLNNIHTIKLIITTVLFLSVSILVFILRNAVVESLHYLVGSLMFAYGVIELTFSVLLDGKGFIKDTAFYFALMEIILGPLFIFFIRVYTVVCSSWATWSIIKEAFEIKELINELNSTVLTIISFVESLAVIVLSITLLIEPGVRHARVHVYLLVVELILNALIPLLDALFFRKKKEEAIDNA